MPHRVGPPRPGPPREAGIIDTENVFLKGEEDAGFVTGPPRSADSAFRVGTLDPDPGFSAGSRNAPALQPGESDDDAQLRKFRDLLISEFNREPEPLPPARRIGKGQALILGLAAAFNPEFGRSFVGPLLQEQINRPLQERALRQAERDRRTNIGSQIIRTLETRQQRDRLQAEKKQSFDLAIQKFTEQKDVNAKNRELIDKRIDKIDDELSAEVLKDPRILALKRKADIIQDKLKRFINPLTGAVRPDKVEESAKLAAEEDLVLAQITSLLDDLKVPKIGAEDLGDDDPTKKDPPPAPGSASIPTVDSILFGE